MRLFHRTDHGPEIVRDGFRDGAGSYGMATLWLEGVFLSDSPVDINEGATGEDLLEVTVDEALLPDYEIVEELKGYREWCVPADLINRHGTIRLLSIAEEDALAEERWSD